MATPIRERVIREIKEVQRDSPALALVKDDESGWTLRGLVHFDANMGEIRIDDTYEIEIHIPQDYPEHLPTVREIGGRIKEDYLHRNKDGSGTLCLGIPFALRRNFEKNPSLFHFVNGPIVTYLFGYSYYEKHDKLPFEDLPHYGDGIVKYYEEELNIRGEESILRVLKILADDNYRGHHDCPCGNGKRIRDCHGDQIRKLQKEGRQHEFGYEAEQILITIANDGRSLSRKSEWPKKILSSILIDIRNKMA